ncbi:hypothetical protein [Pararhizobium sp. IMCC21322]|uniref:hypothetical protein n=1 Tax=Pararhizobium sp. IMCC21322 TaxID=3067903 RepID=UPI002740BA0C|nr:hypothetical protein [Pararhizobium sp. IMCC21322]
MFMRVWLRRTSLVILFFLSGLSPLFAMPASIVAENSAGYGRMVVTFDGENLVPSYTSSSNNNVMVIEFEDNVETSIDSIAVTLQDYVGVARLDPNGKGLRFSLTRGTRINIQEAGEKLFVDFLPGGWVGLPPTLPEDVVRALAERAERAFKAARAAEQAGVVGVLRPRVEMRVGRHPSFTRLSFGWNTGYNAAFVRDGKNVAINFDTAAPLDLTDITTNLPKGIEHAESFVLDEKLNVVLTVDDMSDVRAFRDGEVYVMDVTTPKSEAGSALTGLDDAGRPQTALLGGNVGSDVPNTPDGASQVSESKGVMDVNATQLDPAREASLGVHNNRQERLAEVVIESATYNPSEAMLEPNEGEQQRQQAPPRPVPEASFRDDDVDDSSVMIVDATVNEGTATFAFQYREDVAAAMFSRANILWIVFDSIEPIELGLAKSVADSFDANMTQIISGDMTVIRLNLPRPLFTNLSKSGTDWIMSLGDRIYEPSLALTLNPIVDKEGLAQIKVPLNAVGRVHEIYDETVGDVLTVVTSFGPSQSLLRGQQFAELGFLATTHGLAVTSRIDDLEVSSASDHALFGRETGLSLSSKAQSRGFQLTPDRLGGNVSDNETISFARTLLSARSEPGEPYRRAADAIFRRVALAEHSERPTLRLEAARFYLANNMPHEAIGMIRLAMTEQPSFENDPANLMLNAAANAMAQRSDEAGRILSHRRLEDNADAAFWRTIAAADMREWDVSYENIKRGRVVLGAYPPTVQHNFLLSAAESSLEYNDRAFADTLLTEINPGALTSGHLARYFLLRGRIAMQAGDTEGAMRSWTQAKALGQRPQSAEVDFLTLQHLHQSGQISSEDVLRELAGLSLRWRGDEIELKSLRLLSRLYADDAQYRKSFQTMKSAVLVDRKSETTRSLQDDINGRFEDLFLHGGASALDPVEALALYYDFRELTPIGVKGDEMVRKLAARLIDVDLLSQATELLAHQVDNRLRGTARAQIAADLAFVHILNKEPHRALQAIRRTQQAQLPNLLDRQRRLLEAKALADTGKPDLAVTLVKNLQGNDAERLIGDIQWDAQNWQAAAESYERVAADSWSDEGPLAALQRQAVLKAGIGYSLAGDGLGQQRLRGKFAEKMGDSEDAGAFDVVTTPLEGQGLEFRTVSQQLTTSDAMRSFLSDYRRRYIAPPDGRLAARSTDSPDGPSRDATMQNEEGLAVDGAV